MMQSLTIALPSVEKLALDDVYEVWFHNVCRWARAFGGMDADLDDLAQEVFLVVQRKLSAFDGENLGGWLYKITERTVSDYRRRAWFRHLWSRRGELRDDIGSRSTERDLEAREARRVVARVLQCMSAKRRVAFVLFEIEGYSGDEIAVLEGVPVATIWTRLHEARKEFAERMRKEGVK
jgi:RNA polymerase sigma-70 factor (ECF subfamily)